MAKNPRNTPPGVSTAVHMRLPVRAHDGERPPCASVPRFSRADAQRSSLFLRASRGKREAEEGLANAISRWAQSRDALKRKRTARNPANAVPRWARSRDGAPKGPWETVRLSKGMVLFPVVSVALPLEAAAPACARYTSHLDDPKDSGRALRIAKGRI